MRVTSNYTGYRSAVPSPLAQRRARPTAHRPALLIESVSTMNEHTAGTTFRGLPLTDGQDREIRHYIHTKERRGEPWDTPELQAMLADMLNPPEVIDDDARATDNSMAAERATAESEESLDTDKPQPHAH
jgi:hypothetical protein